MRENGKRYGLSLESRDSILQAADKLVSAARDLMRAAKTEEDLRIGFEKILEPVCHNLGIKSEPRYEKSIYSGGRSDALHGRVIIEYEPPASFKSSKCINHAYSQLLDYIKGEAEGKKESLFYFDPKYIGVGFDGAQIFFVRYKGDKSKPKAKFENKDFVIEGSHPFDTQSARTLLTYLRALSRKLLTAENLEEIFGPKSKIAPLAVSAFAEAFEHWGNERVHVFFNEWKRLFGIVYGEKFGAHQKEEARALSDLYTVGKETDFQELLFSVHTYFAFLMKLIAVELITLKESTLTTSFSSGLTHSSKDELKERLADIEDGGIYAKRGITNFLEGDFFRWYLDAFSPRLEEAIREIARGLSEFESATPIIDPESTRDLLKKLYQYLVPKEVRHKLGEYYTPDWLAELVLDELDYNGDTHKRILDPACGSGTFLVLAIQRAKEYGRTHKEPPVETAKRIVANVWGFDLNPLAVIAARTNYLFALGAFAQELQSFEIPIYLADSVLWPERKGQMQLRPTWESVEIQTSIQTFFIPKIWIEDKGLLMQKAAPCVEKMAKEQYTVSEAMERFKKEGLVFPPHEEVVGNFYGEILKLEKQGKNGIWARFLKNAFAPMVAGKFDFVAGNPPWIRWDYLSQEYRAATLNLWKNYGLFSLKGFQSRLGGGKKDFSMLFVYACSDHYLKDSARLGFLITQEVLKSKGAGEGFRRFCFDRKDKRQYLKVLKAHDLVTIQPFEGAANKTAAIILKKGDETVYPVPYIVWEKKKGVGRISTEMTLANALPLLRRKNLYAQPMGSKLGAWQTITADKGVLAADTIEGKNHYKAILGANPNPYGVFWLEIKQALSDGNIIIRNLPEMGKLSIPNVEATIESDLVYPSIRGADIKRWGYDYEIFLLMVQDAEKRVPYSQEIMKRKWPRTFSYLTNFKDILLNRGSKTIRRLAETTEFYAMFGIEKRTLSSYKVVWKAMSNDIYASVISQIKTKIGFKLAIPLHTTSFFAADNEPEAHYLCAIINSTPVRNFIKSFSSAGRGFGTPSIMQHVGIPRFNPKDKIHQKLFQLSKTLHDLKAKNLLDEVARLEKEVDVLVSRLFGIKEE